MKGITLIFALIFSVVINAQDIKPVFEQDGEMLKATYYHDNGVVSQKNHFPVFFPSVYSPMIME